MAHAVVQLLAATGTKGLRGREKTTSRTEPVERFAKGELRARMSRRQAEVKFHPRAPDAKLICSKVGVPDGVQALFTRV